MLLCQYSYQYSRLLDLEDLGDVRPLNPPAKIINLVHDEIVIKIRVDNVNETAMTMNAME